MIGMKKFLLLFLLLCLSACAVGNIPDGKSSSELAAEAAAIETSIAGTLSADWTATPFPTLFFTETPAPTETPTQTAVPSETPLPTGSLSHRSENAPKRYQTRTPQPGSPTPDGRPLAKTWRDWSVLPVISDTALELYRYGVTELGNDPHRVSVIGDCHSEPNVFMGIYDTDYYDLSEQNQYLTAAIDWFKGSFSEQSYSVHAGMSVSSVLTSSWADPEVCRDGESALECEIRVHHPSIMFVNLGSNWIPGLEMDLYYEYLAEIVQLLCDHGILPILSSKADNAEGDWGINETTAQVARDFNVPFFNFWPIAQNLPYHGLDPEKDGIHLSVEAWNWRNFYALKTLYSLGHALELY